MKRTALALIGAGIVGVTALASPSPAEARWPGGWGPGIAGGLIGAAVIGGLASSAYAYGLGYSYGGYPYYGGYAPAYYGYRHRRAVRLAFAYYGGTYSLGIVRHHRWHRHYW